MMYQDWINELSALLPQPLVTGGFNPTSPFQDNRYNTVIPRAIEYAELMIYRDPDIKLQTMTDIDTSVPFTAGSRTFFPASDIAIVDSIVAIVPVGDQPNQGTRIPFLAASLDTINAFWPNESITQAPSLNGPGPYFAVVSDIYNPPTQTGQYLIVAPTPDQAYTVEVIGQMIPTPLQQVATSATYVTTNYPDLFIAASMIYWTAVMKDWGAQTDDPRMAVSWDAQYQKQKAIAASFENRKRQMGSGWTSLPSSPTGTSMRGTTGASQSMPSQARP